MSKPVFIGSNVEYHDHSREYNIDARGKNLAEVLRACEAEDITPAEVVKSDETPDEELFKYIHPSVIAEDEKRQIHLEIQNLVRHLPLPEICKYLRQMYKQKRVYLNVRTDAMFDELHRMGMPDESNQGFSQKNFQNYFNIND